MTVDYDLVIVTDANSSFPSARDVLDELKLARRSIVPTAQPTYSTRTLFSSNSGNYFNIVAIADKTVQFIA